MSNRLLHVSFVDFCKDKVMEECIVSFYYPKPWEEDYSAYLGGRTGLRLNWNGCEFSARADLEDAIRILKILRQEGWKKVKGRVPVTRTEKWSISLKDLRNKSKLKMSSRHHLR